MTRRWLPALCMALTGCGTQVVTSNAEEPAGDAAPPATEAEPEPGLCGRSSDAPILTLPGRRAVLFADGSERTLETSEPEEHHVIVGRADHVAAVGWHAPEAHQTMVDVFDLTGERIALAEVFNVSSSPPELSIDGDVLLELHGSGGGLDQYVLLAGGGMHPVIAPPKLSHFASDGRIVATVEEPGWYDPFSAEWTPAPLALAAGSRRHHRDGYLALHLVAGVWHMSRVSPTDTVTWSLPGIEGETPWLATASTQFALVEDVAAHRRWRVSLIDGSTVEVSSVPPEGAPVNQGPPDGVWYCAEGARLTEDGRTIIAGVTDRITHFLVDPVTGVYETLGWPVTGVTMVGVGERGGSFVIEGNGAGSSFCPGPVGKPDLPRALGGQSLQVARPSDGILRQLEGRLLDIPERALDSSGHCVLTVSEEGHTLLVDIVRDEVVDLGTTSAEPLWWQDPI